MSLQRRGFLGAMLAACSAPAFVPAGRLMRVVAPPDGIWLPPSQVKDELSDLIWRISPADTPLMQFARSRHQLGNGLHMWVADQLAVVEKQ